MTFPKLFGSIDLVPGSVSSCSSKVLTRSLSTSRKMASSFLEVTKSEANWSSWLMLSDLAEMSSWREAILDRLAFSRKFLSYLRLTSSTTHYTYRTVKIV